MALGAAPPLGEGKLLAHRPGPKECACNLSVTSVCAFERAGLDALFEEVDEGLKYAFIWHNDHHPCVKNEREGKEVIQISKKIT